MAEYIKADEFVEICKEHDCNLTEVRKALLALRPNGDYAESNILARIKNYRRKGLLPLDSGNSVSAGEILKKSSTLYGPNGEVKLQWVSTDVDKEQFLEQFQTAIKGIAETIPVLPEIPQIHPSSMEDLATLYISNDVHFGALMWDKESGDDWNLELATSTLNSSYDHLMDSSPSSKVGIVCDLGDLLEVDNDKNMTPKSGNILSVDSRFPKILRAAYESLIYGIRRALEKHEIVYFYNIVGNHDINAGTAVREVIRVAFQDNPRVIVDESPSNIKYHQHGSVLLQFAHGDGLKMRDAGETMAFDCQDIFSSTQHRFAHFGHTHKDAVYDSRLCRSESHRNLAPLNHWAYNMGYRSGAGSMKSITYHADKGEVSRNIYNVTK